MTINTQAEERKQHVAQCAGLYCGRREVGPGKYSECDACPRGFRPDDNSLCTECNSNPSFYDWLYLGFMALLSVALHFFYIDYTNTRKRSIVVLHLSALAESVIAAILTLLLTDPKGSLEIRSCSVQRLEDWYSMLYNPSPNYTTTLHCTQEIVFPLYTIVMIYYAFSLLLLICIRPIVSIKFVECKGTKSIYAALYFLPLLIVTQAMFAGLLYYSFPYIIIISSLYTSAIHMASCLQQGFRDLIIDNVTNIRNLMILVGHWLMHCYGIISLTELQQPALDVPLMILVFAPVVFYLITSTFTDPNNLDRTD